MDRSPGLRNVLEARRERAKVAEAWLMALRERVEEIKEERPEAYQKRRQPAKPLVERIVVGRDESENIRLRITYRFVPPSEEPANSRR